MANDKKILAKLDIDTSALLESSVQLKKEIDSLRQEQEKLTQKGRESSAQFVQNAAALKSLEQAYRSQQQALAAQSDAEGKILPVKKAIKQAINEVNQSENDYLRNNQSLLALKRQLNTTDGDYQARLQAINAKLQENNNWLQENGSQHTKLITTYNDFKNRVAESFNSINIFNGGLGGLISRAQEAGGAGPLLKNAFDGIASGIGGMTKSALAFVATPIGAVITALSLAISAVVSYFKDTQEGIDKVTAITRPLQSVFEALMGVFQNVGKFLTDAFSSPQKAMSDLYEFVKQNLINRFTAFGTILEGIINLDFKKVGNGILQAATGVEDVIGKTQKASQEAGAFLDEAWKKGQKVDELQKKLDKGLADYTKKTSDLKLELEAHNKVTNDTNATFAQREAAATKALQTAKEQNRLVLERLDIEIDLLKTKQSQGNVSDSEKAELAELLAKRKEAATQQAGQEKELGVTITGIHKERQEKAQALMQKAYDDTLTRLNEELANYKAHNAEKAQSLEQMVNAEQEMMNKSKAILDTQLKAKRISQMAYDTELTQLKQAAAEKVTALTLEHANAEIALEIATNKSKIDANTRLTQDIVDEEANRLNKQRQMRLDALVLEQGIDDARVTQKQANNEALTTKEMEYLTEKARLNEEYDTQINDNRDALEQTIRDQKISQAQADQEIALANAADKFEQDRIMEDARHEEEVAKLKERKDQGLITEQQYNTLMEQEAERTANNKKAIEKAVMDHKLGLASTTFGNLAAIMGKESAAGKAMAVAQATIETYKSATSAFSSMSAIPIVGPALGAVAAAAAVASGIANVKKITSTKAPKAEKGALFSIGGKRHSAGGTMFTGEDGTRFEAESGEVIGVMNRNAARHFMAFNNTFPAVGSMGMGNYFESGGIVSRDIAPASINMQEFAAATAEAVKSMPAPVVSVQNIITGGNSYVRVRDGANF